MNKLVQMNEYQFNDIAALQAIVGETWSDWSNEFQVSQEVINQFADLTNDHNWIHVDVERCEKESPFGGPIAHGFLTLVLMSQVRVTPNYKLVGYKSAVNKGVNKVRFTGNVPAGCKIHHHTRVASVTGSAKGTEVIIEGAIHVVGNEKPSMVYELVMFYL